MEGDGGERRWRWKEGGGRGLDLFFIDSHDITSSNMSKELSDKLGYFEYLVSCKATTCVIIMSVFFFLLVMSQVIVNVVNFGRLCYFSFRISLRDNSRDLDLFSQYPNTDYRPTTAHPF